MKTSSLLAAAPLLFLVFKYAPQKYVWEALAAFVVLQSIFAVVGALIYAFIATFITEFIKELKKS